MSVSFVLNPTGTDADGAQAARLQSLVFDRSVGQGATPQALGAPDKFAPQSSISGPDLVSDTATLSTRSKAVFLSDPTTRAAIATSSGSSAHRVATEGDATRAASQDGECSQISPVEGVTDSEEAMTPAQLRSHRLAVARHERNRQSAARSNAKRKAKNANLRDSLATAKKRATDLRTVETELRNANSTLRTKLNEDSSSGKR